MSKKLNLLIMAITVLLFSAIGFASCVNETETPETQPSDLITRSVTFSIKLPGGDAVHFTRAVNQETTEYAISHLWMLVFDAADEKLIAKTDIAGSTLNSTGAVGDNVYNYTYTATDRQTTAVRIVLIANETETSLSDLVVNTSTLSSLADRTIANVIAAEAQSTTFANGLPMYGVAKTADNHEVIPLTATGSNQAVTVTMTRCVARVDVYNEVNNFTITGLEMKQLKPTGYLIPHAANAVPTGARVNGVTPFSATSLPLAGNSTTATFNKQSFYIFEEQETTSVAADACPILQITGNISSIPVYYEIPFKQDYVTSGTEGSSIQITRNHIYKVKVSGTATVNTRVMLSLSVAGWDDGTTTEKAVGNDLLVGVGNDYVSTTRTFNVAASTTSETIQVAAGMTATITGVEVMMGTSATWGTQVTAHSTNTGENTDWLRARFAEGGQSATLTLTANESTTDDRIGSVRVTYQNSANEEKVIIFTVKQAKTS